MKAVIIEDESYSAKRLEKLLEKVDGGLDVITILSSVEDAKSWFSTNPIPDLIFLDIELSDGTGFDILHHLKSYPRIIFTTAYQEYTLQAFKFNSLDYLLKPIDEQELSKAIQKLQSIKEEENDFVADRIQHLEESLYNQFKERFLIKNGQQYKAIQTEDIAYFYHHKGLNYLKTNEQTLVIDHSLDHLVEELDPKQFFRINRQMIVSFKSVESINTFFNSRLLLTLNPESKIEAIVSRDRVYEFKKWAGL